MQGVVNCDLAAGRRRDPVCVTPSVVNPPLDQRTRTGQRLGALWRNHNTGDPGRRLTAYDR